MIKHGWYMLESIMYGLRCGPSYPEELTEGEKRKLDTVGVMMLKTALPLLGMAKTIASRFPEDLIMQKINAEWLMKQIESRYPEVAQRIRENGEEGWRWLQGQARELALYLTGKLYWDDNLKKFVEAR